MIYNIPIEPLETRYSGQWDRYFTGEFHEKDLDFRNIYGERVSSKIEQGSFLDVVNTNIYKVSQLSKILELIHSKKVKDSDIFFFHDIWFPGLETLAYIRDGLGLDIKIYGCLHAGTYDKNDFLAQKGMATWGKSCEEGWFSLVDKIFVATEYHKSLVEKEREVGKDKIIVTGFPIHSPLPSRVERKNQIVFPHRLDKEKNPQAFDRLKHFFKAKGYLTKFVKTMDNFTTKENYYKTLQESEIAISFAEQETWGIAMQEALFLDCVPLVPDRLSYKEMFPQELRYTSEHNLRQCILRYLNDEEYKNRLIDIKNSTKVKLLKRGEEAIDNMIKEVEL